MCEQETQVGQGQSNGHGCGCGCEETESKPCSFDLGQRYSLDSAAGDSTATDPFPLAGASAVEICVTIFSQAGAASLDVALHGMTDRDNRIAVSTQTITGGVGYYSWSVTGLVWSELVICARAYSGSGSIVFSLYAYTSCAG